jgi:hypothetical protein
MTRRTALRWFTAFAITFLPLAAEDLSGKWSGTATSDHGTETVLLLLKISGSEVTGSIGPRDERQFPIENGRLDGGKLTFQLKGPEGATFQVELALDGDGLKGSGTRSLNGETQTSTLDLKRAR